MKRGFTPLSVAAIALGLLFLYGPIAILVLWSFNASRLVTVWGGFSTRWYGEMLADEKLMTAFVVSLEAALASAVLATILGTLAGIALARRRGWGGSLFAGLVLAPIVMPEVITGLSLLLLFVAMGLRTGFLTLVVAHATFTLCFVAVVVESRLSTFDRSLEEAALDLGATPFRAFFLVTLPIIRPAVLSGFLLAFTLSLDDLVIASFASGPGATTLPMTVYSQVRLGVSPKINAVSTVLLGFVAVAVILASALARLSSAGRRGSSLRHERGDEPGAGALR